MKLGGKFVHVVSKSLHGSSQVPSFSDFFFSKTLRLPTFSTRADPLLPPDEFSQVPVEQHGLWKPRCHSCGQ